jgi:hypothetical protein
MAKLESKGHISTGGVRASHPLRDPSTHRADCTDLREPEDVVRASHACSADRDRRRWWGHWLGGRLIERGISTRRFAEGYLGVSDKTGRDVLTGKKALGPERVEKLDDETFDDFVLELVRQRCGDRGGIVVLGRVMGRLAKEAR